MAGIQDNDYTLTFEDNAVVDVDTGYDGEIETGSGANVIEMSNPLVGTYSCNHEITTGADGDAALGRKDINWPGGDVAYLYWKSYVSSLGNNNYPAALLLGGLFHTGPDTGTVDLALMIQCNNGNCSLRIRYGDNYNDVDVIDLSYVFPEDEECEVELKLDWSGTDAAYEIWIDPEVSASHNSSGVAPTGGVPTTGDPDRFYLGVQAISWALQNNGLQIVDEAYAADARIGGVTPIEEDIAGSLPAMTGTLLRKHSAKRIMQGVI